MCLWVKKAESLKKESVVEKQKEEQKQLGVHILKPPQHHNTTHLIPLVEMRFEFKGQE